MRLFDLEQHSRVELPTQLWKSCVLPLHQCCLKIKNMNFQPFCKGKGPHLIYLLRFDATFRGACVFSQVFSTPVHGFPFFIVLSFEAHQTFVRLILSITSIALYWTASYHLYRFGSVLHRSVFRSS